MNFPSFLAGALIDDKDGSDCTALLMAVSRGNVDMVKWLVNRGAALDVRDERGNSPLLLAVKEGKLDMVPLPYPPPPKIPIILNFFFRCNICSKQAFL